MSLTSLNDLAWQRLETALDRAWALGWETSRTQHGTLVVDAGCHVSGCTQGGLALAEIGMAGLGQACCRLEVLEGIPWPVIEARSSRPVEACLLAQAANWPVKVGEYQAMGSGPACLLNPEVAAGIGLDWVESTSRAVLVLEAAGLPDDTACLELAAACRVPPDQLAVLVAPTSSLAGSAQIAARSVETALHRLHQLAFPIRRIIDAAGMCPVAGPTGSDLTALGRTNDLMMFASQVWLAVEGMPGNELAAWAHRLPARSTPGYGTPFLEAVQAAGGFYNLDPALFAPAEVTFTSTADGSIFHAGGAFGPGLRQALGLE